MKRLFLILALLPLLGMDAGQSVITGHHRRVTFSQPAPILYIKLCGDYSSGSGCAPSSSTTAYDSSASANNATWSGTQSGTTNWYSTIAGSVQAHSGAFNGTDDRLTFGGTNLPSGSAAGSMFAAVYLTGTCSSPCFVVGYGNQSTAQSRYLYVSSGVLVADEYDGKIFSTLSVSTNTWHCVGWTVGAANTSATIYVDGVSQTGSFPTMLNTAITNEAIGQLPSVGFYWTGYINNVEIWNVQLAPGQIPTMANGCT